MDYLRTLGSVAVTTLVQKSGLNLPFSLGSKVVSFEGIPNLYDATKRDDGSPVSVFEYDSNDPSKKHMMAMAKNALRKLRTTRHPDVLKFMDAVETDSSIFIMTERVRPLPAALQTWQSRGAQEREDWLLWGLHRISVALAFLNDSCASTHGNVCVNSIFISPSGEWKLGGFETLSNPKDEAATLYTMGELLPAVSSYAPPEVKKTGWSVLKQYNPATSDAYMLGILIHTTFHPAQFLTAVTQLPYPPSRGSIPTSVFPAYKRLLNPNPKTRLTAKGFLEIGVADAGFFANNPLVKICLGLDNFSLSSELDKTSFLRTLKDSATSFPPEFTLYRVLPSLISVLEYGGAATTTVLPLVLQFGKNASAEEYPAAVLSPVVKLFASPDRSTRMALLDQLPEFAEQLDKKTVCEKIWPHLQSGFSDTVAVIREATVKSIAMLSSKLNDRILNNDLLRYLAKMQADPEASIRTNTCILIGRLGPSLGYNTKRKVLVPAFSRALKDPFVHARVAGLTAFMATIDCFEMEDIANKVIPNMSCTMLDKEKLVRDQAFKAIELFVGRLESHAAAMPETTTLGTPDSSNVLMPAQTTLVNSAAGAAGALAGWALSSVGKKLAVADMQSTILSVPGGSPERPISAPPSIRDHSDSRDNDSPFLTTSTPAKNTIMSSPAISTHPTQVSSRAKGMQLGANKVTTTAIAAALAAELSSDVAALNNGDADPWESGDLIDINADQDDWSAFESAPPVVVDPQTTPAIDPSFVGVENERIPSLQGHGSWDGTGETPGVPEDIDPWGGDSVKPFYPAIQTRKVNPPPSNTAPSFTSNIRPTRFSSPTPPESSDWNSVEHWDQVEKVSTVTTLNTRDMSKEEKAAEMARRKEERKQRIALLKEQKKNANLTKP